MITTKRSLFVLFILLLWGSHFALGESVQGQEKPDYEKYGRIATAVVKADFPSDEVVEYEYQGRSTQPGGDIVIDSFKFEVKDNGKDIFVIIKVAHHLKNKKLIQLTVAEQLK